MLPNTPPISLITYGLNYSEEPILLPKTCLASSRYSIEICCLNQSRSDSQNCLSGPDPGHEFHSPQAFLLLSHLRKQNHDPHVIHVMVFQLSPARMDQPQEKLTYYPVVTVSLTLPFMFLIRSKQKEILLIRRNLSRLLMPKTHSLKTTEIGFTSSCLHCSPLPDG